MPRQYMKNLNIRHEQPEDYQTVEYLTREAFWNVHVPGCDEHYLAHTLRQAPSFVAELDFVAEFEGEIVGNIMYAKTLIHTDTYEDREVLTFGPVSVMPAQQKRGIGSALIRHTLALAKEMGFRAVIIYGDPDYYCRFGFRPGEDFGIRSSEGYYSPALQALELVSGALEMLEGHYIEGDAYHVDPVAASEFDKSYPLRDKFKTPSQSRFQELLSQSHK